MENISRKEAFDCALALSASVINAINEKKESLYDYALLLRKNSLDPIICLKPGEFFDWNEDNKYGEKSYAFVPVGHPYISEAILRKCGSNLENYGHTVTFKKFNASQHPSFWIKEALAKKYLKLIYLGDLLWEYDFEYDSSFFSKCRSTWIRVTVDDIIMYFPYYTEIERLKRFNKLSSNFYKVAIQEFWQE